MKPLDWFILSVAGLVLIIFGMSGVITVVQKSFKASPNPAPVLDQATRQDQRDRIRDTKRKHDDLMRRQKQRIRDMSR